MSSPPSPEVYVPRMANIYYLNTVTCIVVSLFFGIYISLYIRSFAILYHKSSRAANYLLILTTVLLLLATIRFASVLSAVLLQESWEMRTSDELPLLERVRHSSSLYETPGQIAYVVYPITFLLGDAIVVWRAFVICSSHRVIRALLLAMIACAAVYMIFTPIFAIERGYDLLTARMDAASIFLSFAVNLVSTSCIGIKARFFNQAMRKAQSQSTSPISALFSLLTETGAFYCIIQLVNAVLTLFIIGYSPTDPRMLAGAFFEEFTFQYSAMYPSIVVILIAKNKSLVDIVVAISEGGEGSTDNLGPDKEKAVPESGHISTIKFAARD